MRLEFRDGQWAELRDHISHRDAKEIRTAYTVAKDDSGDIWDVGTLIAVKFVRSWHVLDTDGNEIPLDGIESMNRAPDDIVGDIAAAGGKIQRGAEVPNAPTPPSSAESPSAKQ